MSCAQLACTKRSVWYLKNKLQLTYFCRGTVTSFQNVICNIRLQVINEAVLYLWSAFDTLAPPGTVCSCWETGSHHISTRNWALCWLVTQCCGCPVSAGWNTYNAAYLAAFRKKYQTNLLTYVSHT